MSLQNLIIRQDAYALDETSMRSLQKHLQKLAKAAQISFAKGALQQDQIRFLLKINNEAKVRRAIRSIVLGKAKVMSYEDLMEARAKRLEKEAAEVVKERGKRGRKRKSAAPEINIPELQTKVARVGEAPEPVQDPVQMSETQGTEDVIAPGPGRAPVARIW